METYRLPNFPPTFSTIHIALFRNVRNAPDIRKKLIVASTMEGEGGDKARREVDFGFIEGRLLVWREHLLIALMTTLLICLPSTSSSSSSSSVSSFTPTSSRDLPVGSPPLHGVATPDGPAIPTTRTHNLHSELLLTLSPNNNISDSIRRHGISDSTDSLVVVRISGQGSKEDEVYAEMEALVDGELDSLGVLDTDELVDWPRLSKIFKLSELDRLPLTQDEIRQKMIATIINTVAIKHVT